MTIVSACKVSIRTSADVDDIWQTVSKGDQVTLLCDGISNNESSSDDDTDTEIKHQSKRRKVSALEEKSKRSCLNCFMKSTADGLLLYNIICGQKCMMLELTGTFHLHGDLKITCAASTRSMDDPPGIPAFGSCEKHSSQNLLKEMTKVLIPKTQVHHLNNITTN